MDPNLLKLLNLKNLGPKTEAWLRAIGVETFDDLEDMGAVEAYPRLRAKAYCRLRAEGYPATLNLVWSIQATLLGVDWRDLPEGEKVRLRAELNKKA